MSVQEPLNPIEHRVNALEHNFTSMERQLQKIDERTRNHELEQVRTQTLLECVQRDVSTINVTVSKLADAQTATLSAIANSNIQQAQQEVKIVGSWEKFYSKSFWAIAGGIILYAGSIIVGHFVK